MPALLDAWWVTVAATANGEVVMGRRRIGGLALGLAGIAALGSCGDEGASSQTTSPLAVAVDDGADTPTTTSTLAGVLPTTRAPDTTVAAGDGVVINSESVGPWMRMPFAGPSEYVGPPLEELMSRTTDTGIVIHAYAWPDGPSQPMEGGPGWTPAPWCTPSANLRVSMRFGEAVSIGHGNTFAEPFGGISVQPLLAGYAEGTPFTVLLVQAGQDTDSVTASFADGTIDSAEATNGLALLAAPTAPAPEENVWTEGRPPGPGYTLSIARGTDVVEVASADVPFPVEDDYRRECQPPTELPEAGEQPADPVAAEQAVRDAFAAVFDFSDRQEGDRTWMEHLDSDDGVEAAIEVVLGGTYGSAAQSADYTMGELVFTSPTEAWFTYDLFANSNSFNGRFGLAVNVDGTWKISRGVICQDLALAGGRCEPPIGQLYPPSD